MANKEEMITLIADYVENMEDDKIIPLAQEYIAAGHSARDAIMLGLTEGICRAAKLYDEDEYSIPELLLCSHALYNGLEVLKPHMDGKDIVKKCKILIGVVEGDTHDIGKNLVKIMLEADGYDIIDLGKDVPNQTFIDVAKETGAKVIALSTLMSTTMHSMQKIIDLLEENNMRDKVKVIIGGATITEGFAKEIGADGYSKNAPQAVKLINDIV